MKMVWPLYIGARTDKGEDFGKGGGGGGACGDSLIERWREGKVGGGSRYACGRKLLWLINRRSRICLLIM